MARFTWLEQRKQKKNNKSLYAKLKQKKELGCGFSFTEMLLFPLVCIFHWSSTSYTILVRKAPDCIQLTCTRHYLKHISAETFASVGTGLSRLQQASQKQSQG